MSGNVLITNRSKQLISLQVKPPNGDFFHQESQSRIAAGRSVSLPKKYLNWAQVENLKAKQFIAVVDQ